MTTKRRILLVELTPNVQQPLIFATWNPADKDTDVALSGGDLTATKSTTHATNWSCVRATYSMPVGQWYWESTITFTGSASFGIGIGTIDSPLNQQPGDDQPAALSSVAVLPNGEIRLGSFSLLGDLGSAISSGDVLRFWVDKDAKIIRIALNGGAWIVCSLWPWSNTISPWPFAGFKRPSLSTVSCTNNFGQTTFAYTPPDGVNKGVYSQTLIPTNLYVSNDKMNATIGGTPVSFMARIAADQDVEIEREGSCWVWGGNSISRRGQLVIINNDGALKEWRNYLWRDTPAVLRAGWEGDLYEDFEVWAFSRIDTIELTKESRIILTFIDPVSWLDRQLQTNLYPEDQANLQLAGQPVPIVYGTPKFCTAARLDTNPTVRDYQLHDKDSGPDQLTEITEIFDSGDVFYAPFDPFVPHDAITSANGGNFGSWSGSPAKPQYWNLPAGAGEFSPPNNTFLDLGGGFMRCICTQAPSLRMQCIGNVGNPATLRANTMYRITFNCSSITTPGKLYFRAGTQEVSVVFVALGTGAKSVDLFVTDAAQLQLVMKGDGCNIIIATLRASAIQVIDWTYWGGTRGFNLTNAPYGKIVANPVSPVDQLDTILADFAARTVLPDITIDGATIDGMNIASAVTVGGLIPAKAEIYVNTPTTALSLIKELLSGWCGFITSNQFGQIVFGKIKEPQSYYDGMLILSKTNIKGGVTILTDVAKQLSLRLAGAKNYTVHTATDIASAVPQELATQLQTEYLYTIEGAPSTGNPVSSAYAAAIGAPSQKTFLSFISNLRSEINRVATLWRKTRNFYFLTATLDPSLPEVAELEPGSTVFVVWPEWGLDEGKEMLVVGIRSRFFSRKVTFKLWR